MGELYRRPVAIMGQCIHCKGEYRDLCHDGGAYAVNRIRKQCAPLIVASGLCCYCSAHYVKNHRLPAHTMSLPFEGVKQ